MSSADILNTNIENALEKARVELLDQTARNKLINTPRGHSKSIRIDVIDELSEFVYTRLVVEGKHMFFAPRVEQEEESDQFFDDDVSDNPALEKLQSDNILQTALTDSRLQHNLRRLQYDARTYESEQGVNVLYLAVGFLKWYEDQNSDVVRYAPLLLIPLSLTRKSANARFRAEYTGAEIVTNLSIKHRIFNDFGISLPAIESFDEFTPKAYFDQIRLAVTGKPRWEVLDDDITLWFYSFTRFLMYRDLSNKNWPPENQIGNNSLIKKLLVDGFDTENPLCGENDNIDEHIDLLNAVHVLDCDSSQAMAIEEVNRGRNLVIQGPPGTGKSQTIVNLIASAVHQGKTVLFVAEKMAALDVVKRRLASIGLGGICLELHSNKSRKKLVLDELDKTLKLGQPEAFDVRSNCQQLPEIQAELNSYLNSLHTEIENSGCTLFQVVGELVRLTHQETLTSSITLDGAVSWSRGEFDKRRQVLDELLAHLQEIGDPTDHLWRGIDLKVIIPSDLEAIISKVRDLLPNLIEVRQLAQALTTLNDGLQTDSLLALSNSLRLIRYCFQVRNLDVDAIADDCWDTQRDYISKLVTAGIEYTNSRRELHDVIDSTSWNTDVSKARKAIKRYGSSLFRIFRKDYRDASKTLNELLQDPPPTELEDKLKILDVFISGQQAEEFIATPQATLIGQKAFGTCWLGEDSSWSQLESTLTWVNEGESEQFPSLFRQLVAELKSDAQYGEIQKHAEQIFKPTCDSLDSLLSDLNVNISQAFSVETVRLADVNRLEKRLTHWIEGKEAIYEWVKYRQLTHALAAFGLEALIALVESNSIAWDEVVRVFESAYFDALLRAAYARTPVLANFSALSHEAKISKFVELDSLRIEMAKLEVAQKHYETIPHGGTIGEVGLVKREIEKKTRHLPIRKLLAKAGSTIQSIKPVFMMSPLSIAQFLDPGTIEFDLLVIDEASQVKPVDALGAMARCKQFVVVGDSKQLPPTSFFDRRESDNEDQEDDAIESAGVMESILSLCCAQNVNERMLRWHYRSKHHTLISVSNNEFYDNRLNVIPSPRSPDVGEGLIFNFLEEAYYDRGKSATNPIEAEAVADAVIQHFKEFPEKTLGVGTFSVRQRDKILDEIELRRRENPELEQYFSQSGEEPFFVKNLENIQGDERDVILISICYGKDEVGYMAMNFGPLSNDGGERRLNVLISRAREACVVYSCIGSEDIDTNRAKAKGAKALKVFLRYAQHGLLDNIGGPGKDFDSEFERQVAVALEAEGYEVHPQVGTAGFFIDLAIVNPQKKGEYLLGIECDGANYHSSRSARDRDRLRRAVLEHHGWNIHRIWSTDWFQRPKESLKKVIDKIQLAEIGNVPQQQISTGANAGYQIAREEMSDDANEISVATEDYAEVALRRPLATLIPDTPTSLLARRTTMIIRAESPVHETEIIRRLTVNWGVKSSGSRIKDAVRAALQASLTEQDISQHGDFFTSSKVDADRIRDRTAVTSSNLKKAEFLPPMEVANAIIRCLEINPRSDIDGVSKVVSRSLGIKSRSSHITDFINSQIGDLVVSGKVKLVDGILDLQ